MRTVAVPNFPAEFYLQAAVRLDLRAARERPDRRVRPPRPRARPARAGRRLESGRFQLGRRERPGGVRRGGAPDARARHGRPPWPDLRGGRLSARLGCDPARRSSPRPVADRRGRPRARLPRRRARACVCRRARLRRRAPVRPADQAARGGCRPHRLGALRRAGGGLWLGRARAACADVRAHAPAPRRSRPRTRRVHRQRIPRVADAPVLPGRLSRAAGRSRRSTNGHGRTSSPRCASR